MDSILVLCFYPAHELQGMIMRINLKDKDIFTLTTCIDLIIMKI